jgi:hypothetical protein
MQIYTASWFTQLPPEIAPIGISRGTPRGQSGYRMYRRLAPGPWFRSVDVDTYYKRYAAQLHNLDASKVVEELFALSDGRPLAMLCFEGPKPGPDWCHRALVSVWLHDRLGWAVPEYGLEDEGCGWAHPKLPPEWRVLG